MKKIVTIPFSQATQNKQLYFSLFEKVTSAIGDENNNSYMSKYWLKEPEMHDFAAAADYKSLLVNEQEAIEISAKLKEQRPFPRK